MDVSKFEPEKASHDRRAFKRAQLVHIEASTISFVVIANSICIKSSAPSGLPINSLRVKPFPLVGGDGMCVVITLGVAVKY